MNIGDIGDRLLVGLYLIRQWTEIDVAVEPGVVVERLVE